jgi:hypothetical protein
MADAEPLLPVPAPEEPLPPPPDDGPRYCRRCRTRLGPHPLDDAATVSTKCVRCGLAYDPARPETYLGQRMPMRWRFWVPFFVVAIVAGVASYGIIFQNGTMGYALFFGVPFAIGGFLGYGTRVSFWMTLLLSLLAIACVVCALLAMDFSGIFCGLTLGLFFLVPALVGCGVGWILKVATRDAAWDNRRFVFMGMFLGLPLGVEQVESRWPITHDLAEVSTSTTFDAPVDPTWEAIVFYEEIKHKPPFLLKLALPQPARTEGKKEAVGDEQKCIYKNGYLVKTITHLDPPRLLAFDVTEQHLHFEHDVDLVDGSFILQPMARDKTRVILTTRYRRLLRPSWLWEPIERTVIQTLHGHVLDGMRGRAMGEG